MIRTSIISFFITISILPVLILPGCGGESDDSRSYAGLEFNPEGNFVAELPQFLQEAAPIYNQLSTQIKDSGKAYAALEAFTWQGLDSLGFWEIQSAGAACGSLDRIYSKDEQPGAFSAEVKWIPLNTIIPSRDRVKTLGISLSRSLDTAVRINPANYSKTPAASENQNQKEWLDLCRGLDSSLKSALYLAATLEKTSNFATVNEAFKQASSSTRDKYFTGFGEQSKQFGSLLSALISRLTAAEATALKLTGADSK